MHALVPVHILVTAAVSVIVMCLVVRSVAFDAAALGTHHGMVFVLPVQRNSHNCSCGLPQK